MFYGIIGDKSFRLAEKDEKSCLRFFWNYEKILHELPHGLKYPIKNRFQNLSEETVCWYYIWFSDNKNSKGKVHQNSKFCAFDYF